MGKETVKNTYVLQEDENIGTVQIADEVVAIIASLAATEVEGVSSMAGNITNELMSKVGVKGLTKGRMLVRSAMSVPQDRRIFCLLRNGMQF